MSVSVINRVERICNQCGRVESDHYRIVAGKKISKYRHIFLPDEKQLFLINFKHVENDKTVSEHCITTNKIGKKYKNLTDGKLIITVRTPKKGDECNAYGSQVIKFDSDYGVGFNKDKMAEGVIYGFWMHGIVINIIRKGDMVFMTPTEKGVR